jgi:hypothetical protein
MPKAVLVGKGIQPSIRFPCATTGIAEMSALLATILVVEYFAVRPVQPQSSNYAFRGSKMFNDVIEM